MMRWSIVFACYLLVGRMIAADDVGFVTAAEMEHATEWTAATLSADIDQLPFSFHYGGQSSRDFLSAWAGRTVSTDLGDGKTQTTRALIDAKTGLEVRCVSVTYTDYPAVEWTVYLKNAGHEETPLITNLNALDMHISRGPGEHEFWLHHAKGARATRTDYHPYETALVPGSSLSLRTSGGRATNGSMPYFNVAWNAPQRGLVVAIGWPGQWSASLSRDQHEGLRLTGKQEDTSFVLHPGEEVRTPLMALVHYDGDWLRGQNVWRRWMLAHNVPGQDGGTVKTQLLACSSHQFNEMLNATEENQKFFIDRYREEQLPLDYWWMDAGWYINDGTWQNTGTWEIDREQFPNGFRPITDHGRSKGVKSIVWFEPERVTKDSWLYDERPQWLLTASPNDGRSLYDDAWRLLDLGNYEARTWLTDHIDGMIKSEGIDLYRQDFNIAPLQFWRNNDEPNRIGITENKYITGYLAYWDALLERNPGIRIDSCASGGRRNDLETMRRSVPLLRSDSLFEPNGQQCHTYGISFWLPYHGTGTHIGESAIGHAGSESMDVYAFRSHMNPSVTACWDMRDRELDYDTLRKMSGQLKRAQPNYLGDYYPLTPYATDTELGVWLAWQFNRPEEGTGVVHAFRRAENDQSEMRLRLHGLNPSAKYKVEIAEHGAATTLGGQELMDGLLVELPKARSAAVIYYERK